MSKLQSFEEYLNEATIESNDSFVNDWLHFTAGEFKKRVPDAYKPDILSILSSLKCLEGTRNKDLCEKVCDEFIMYMKALPAYITPKKLPGIMSIFDQLHDQLSKNLEIKHIQMGRD